MTTSKMRKELKPYYTEYVQGYIALNNLKDKREFKVYLNDVNTFHSLDNPTKQELLNNKLKLYSVWWKNSMGRWNETEIL